MHVTDCVVDTAATNNALDQVLVLRVTQPDLEFHLILLPRLTVTLVDAPTDGQLLIGDTATGLFDAATLTEGANVTNPNAAAAITIAAAGGTAANPTGEVGPAAINGTAVTFMRSDAAPALARYHSCRWSLYCC